MKVEMDLYNDWIETVKEIFRGSGAPLPQDWSAEEVGREYYLQTSSSEEEAEERRKANEQRLTDMQRTLLDNMETVVVPDIREKRAMAAVNSASAGFIRKGSISWKNARSTASRWGLRRSRRLCYLCRQKSSGPIFRMCLTPLSKRCIFILN